MHQAGLHFPSLCHLRGPAPLSAGELPRKDVLTESITGEVIEWKDSVMAESR